MRRGVRGWATTAAVSLLVAVSPSPAIARSQDVTTLQGDRAIERRLDRAEEHRYAIALRDGEYARVVVDQHGMNVIARVRGIDEALIAAFDDEPGDIGREIVEIVADAPGIYTIDISAAPGTVAPVPMPFCSAAIGWPPTPIARSTNREHSARLRRGWRRKADTRLPGRSSSMPSPPPRPTAEPTTCRPPQWRRNSPASTAGCPTMRGRRLCFFARCRSWSRRWGATIRPPRSRVRGWGSCTRRWGSGPRPSQPSGRR